MATPVARSPGEPRLSERAKWLLLALVTLGLLAALVVVAEVGLRVRQQLRYGIQQPAEQVYETDARIGLRVPKANLDTGRIQTNSLGFRGPEISGDKPAGAIRLAFLGASTTWCAEVSSNAAVWTERVAAQLASDFPNRRFDFVNGGVPGYTLRSSLLNLEHRIASLAPDVIVIYHATNDLSGELRELALAAGLISEARVGAQFWPSRYSLLWDLAEKNIRIALARRRAESGAGVLRADFSRIGEPFRGALTDLVRAAKAKAGIVAVATFSTRMRAQQPPDEKLRAASSALYYVPFMDPDGLIAAFARYNQIIREVARGESIILIDGEDDVPGDAAHFTDSVHFTDAGSAAMARRVAAGLHAGVARAFR
ncbi:MAG: SGNH/GDSL hydrolase family protein [Burkholderiaceae bacterium]|nr:SGNH/GDSL hydrolase family protein [Burkholderiaceae bacterium]